MTFLAFHVNDIRTRTQLISTADSPSSATVRWKSASDTGSWFFWWNLSAGNIMDGTFRVDVKPGRVFFTDLDKVYPMVATPRGLALIINNETFACPSFYTQRYVILYIYIYIRYITFLPRYGSAADTACLESLFQQLGFSVTVAQNLTRNETLIKIIEFSDSIEHSEANMAIVCISSHGRFLN